MKKTLSVILMIVMTFATIAAALPSYAASGFSDVEDGRWSAGSIEYAVKKSYMNGVGGGLFDPEGSLTRAMVATVLWRREGSPAPAAPSGFSDVPSGEWYTDAVAWAKETGVVKGLTETTFGPDEYITREQLSTMLFRFSSGAPVSVPERADLTPFADDENVSDWADEPLEWAVEAGLINGTDGNRLDPAGSATREQFAAIIERYDAKFRLAYNRPVVKSSYTEPEYPLVTDADFFVSTDGDDSNPGTPDKPFATFGRAVEAVRELKKTKTSGDIKVAFKSGVYQNPAVAMTAEDSGSDRQRIVYCRYGDGDVTFSGGEIFPSSDFEPVPADVSAWFGSKQVDRIGRIDLSSVLPEERDGLGFTFNLFSDTEVVYPARYPNKYADGTTQFLFDAFVYASPKSMSVESPVMANRMAKYHTLEYAQVYGIIIHGYQRDTLTASSYDKEANELFLIDPNSELITGSFSPFGLQTQTCLANVSEELDANGEYWLDRDSGYLYVYNPKGSYYIPGKGGVMVTMDEVNNVTFLGLGFKNSADRFIDARLCHGITFDRCSFEVSGADNPVVFEDSLPGRDLDLAVTGCEFRIMNGGALHVEGDCAGEYRGIKNANVTVDNNFIEFGNMNVDFNGAFAVVDCAHCTFSHNRFLRCNRAAIHFTGSYNVTAEYNVFEQSMYESGDGGTIYSHGGFGDRGNVIRYNVFYEQPTDNFGSYGTYMDGQAGTEIYSNLFYNTGHWAMTNTNGRDEYYHDNVSVWTHSGYGVGVWITTENLEAMRDNDAYTYEEAINASWSVLHCVTHLWEPVLEKLSLYENYRKVAEELWPEILPVHLDFSRLEEPEFALNPVNTVENNVGIWADIGKDNTSFYGNDEFIDKYCTYENNVFYTTDENRLFVNPTEGDYRIREGADFPDIRFEDIGRY